MVHDTIARNLGMVHNIPAPMGCPTLYQLDRAARPPTFRRLVKCAVMPAKAGVVCEAALGVGVDDTLPDGAKRHLIGRYQEACKAATKGARWGYIIFVLLCGEELGTLPVPIIQAWKLFGRLPFASRVAVPPGPPEWMPEVFNQNPFFSPSQSKGSLLGIKL